MHDYYERRSKGGGFYLRDLATGRRTRLYVNLEACYRAAARDELYTEAEYAALTAPTVGAAPRRMKTAKTTTPARKSHGQA